MTHACVDVMLLVICGPWKCRDLNAHYSSVVLDTIPRHGPSLQRGGQGCVISDQVHCKYGYSVLCT